MHSATGPHKSCRTTQNRNTINQLGCRSIRIFAAFLQYFPCCLFPIPKKCQHFQDLFSSLAGTSPRGRNTRCTTFLGTYNIPVEIMACLERSMRLLWWMEPPVNGVISYCRRSWYGWSWRFIDGSRRNNVSQSRRVDIAPLPPNRSLKLASSGWKSSLTTDRQYL